MSKYFWAAIAIIIVVFGGILLFRDNKSNSSTGGSSNVQPTNHVEGLGKSGVKVVEYGDYQCPYCGEYEPIVEQVVAKYHDQITFQFRNLPLLQIHQNAFAAARAAEAAGLQNKFWEMHNLIYQDQAAWEGSTSAESVFTGYAQQLGLNTTQFKTDFASSKVNDMINADINEFNKTGQEMSTPTFFLDGKKVQPKDLNEFSKLIDTEIAAKAKNQ